MSDQSNQQAIQSLTERLQACQAELARMKQQRDQEIRYGQVLETVPDGLVLFDRNFHSTYLNAAGARLFEQIHTDKGEAETGSTVHTFSLEETLIQTVFDTGQPVRMEHRLTTAPNTPFIEIRFVPQARVEGKIQTVLAILRDDTGRKRVSEAQQISEQLVRAAIAHAGIQVYTQDRELCYNWIFDQQRGLFDQAYPGKRDEDFYNAEDTAKLHDLKQQVLDTGQPIQEEIDLHHNNELHSFELIIQPIKGPEGNVTGLLCSSLDITERRKIWLELERLANENRKQKDMLSRQNDLLQAIFDINPAGLAVLTGEMLEHRFANPTYRTMLPYPEVDPVGLRYTEVWPQTENFRGSWIIRRVMETGNPVHLERYPQEFSDGSTRYYSIRLKRLTWDNQPAVLITLWDVTSLEAAYQQAEQAAEEARLRAMEAEQGRGILEAVLEYAPQGIAIANAQGQIPYVSRYGKEMAAFPSEDEHPPQRILCLEDQQKVWQIYQVDGNSPADNDLLPLTRAVNSGEVTIDQEWVMKGTGEQLRFISCNAGPIRNRNGVISGGIIIWQDVTERKQAEAALADYAERLKASNRELEEFASVASHDLQEPLRKIQSFGSLLLLEQEGENSLPEEKQAYLKRMISTAQRMQQMINDLLTYSRVSSKSHPAKWVNLNKLVQDVLYDLEPRIHASQGQVIIEHLPQVYANPLHMRQLMQNLIGNALKYHRPEVPPLVKVYGENLLSSDPNPKNIAQLFVEDNGIGIDSQYWERIFQPFERLHGRSEYEGTGMGMAICQKIVEQYHGTITAHSEMGVGSTFVVTLPIVSSEKEQA